MDTTASPQHVAVCEHYFEADHVISRHSVFQTARAARVRGDISTDGAILHTRRIRRIKQFLRAHRRLQVRRKHPRLNNRNCIGKTDILYPIHAHERQGNPATCGDASPHVTKSTAPCCNRNLFVRRKLQQLADIARRFGKDDNFRLVCREPFVAAVCSKCLWIGSDDFLA